MKYIYDIVLNFNELFYEFYEWNDEDNIEYIKRIPIIKVSCDNMNIIKNYKIIMDNNFIESIKNMTEIYTDNNIIKTEYACLFCSNTDVIAIEFNSKGLSILKSDLIVDEALDIIDYSSKMKNIPIIYEMVSIDKKVLYTREETNKINFMNKEVDYIYKSNIDKLKYIYYECFNESDIDTLKMYKRIKEYINDTPNKLYELLMLKGLQK